MKTVHFPVIRFARLAAREGGITRAIAVETARNAIESARPQSDKTILASIAAIEAIVYAPETKDTLHPDDMRTILRHADQVVTLASMFGYDRLDAATRGLCDLTDGLLTAGLFETAPVLVHVQAMRLMAPGAAPMTPDEADEVFDGLGRVQARYSIRADTQQSHEPEIVCRDD